MLHRLARHLVRRLLLQQGAARLRERRAAAGRARFGGGAPAHAPSGAGFSARWDQALAQARARQDVREYANCAVRVALFPCISREHIGRAAVFASGRRRRRINIIRE